MTKMTKRRDHGDGGIDERGENVFRLRYRLDGKRYTTTFHGTRADAKKELRRLVRSGDAGEHIAPDKIRLADWIDRWLALLERRQDGAESEQPRERRRGIVNPRTAERYGELLRLYIKPTLGERPLQAITGTQLDDLYVQLEQKLATRTVRHVHVTLKACLGAAVRKGLIAANPAERAEAPSPGDSQAGQALDVEQLKTLVQGFRRSTLYPIVAMAAFTGARRNEILALRWTDLDVEKKTLRIERAIEETKAFGRVVKEPKSARGRRTIQIDDDLIALLLGEREKHLRVKAGIPDGVTVVDLSLVKLPPDALMFPSSAGETFDFTKLRDPHAVTREFCRQARKRSFAKLRFHDLRGSHETALLDAGVPVHTVASRCGHDPAVLLRTYAKRTTKGDTSAAAAIGALLKGALGD
jgi:integrase